MLSADFPSLCRMLADRAGPLDASGQWPTEQLRLLGEAGVFNWFAPQHLGGQGWTETELLRAYTQLAKACLTTTFVLTQRQGAMGRIMASENEALCQRLLPDLLTGQSFATVGISHLTTSRQHLARPVLRATETYTGFMLEGLSPWVTGSPYADHVVLGATLDDGRQILVALPTDLPGVKTPPPEPLVALAASHTGTLVCHRVEVDREWLIAGPVAEVMKQGLGARTGGLQTSALALGLASAAIEWLTTESQQRHELAGPALGLQSDYDQLEVDLFALAEGNADCTADDVRSRANSLAVRATQAALAAAKGTGFVAGHPTGRWCREALFFLVWSCPQSVLSANLCEFAGLNS